VGLLSQRDTSPYPDRYSRAFAFSTFSYPLPQQLPLRVACLRPQAAGWAMNRAYRVPHERHEWVRSCLYAGDHGCPCTPSLDGSNRSHTFWFKPVSAFGLFVVTALTRQFAFADHATQPSPSSASTLTDNFFPSQGRSCLSAGYIVLAASHALVTKHACASRLRLTEQSVSLTSSGLKQSFMRLHVAPKQQR
jgi:hypothetical protein